MRLPPHSRAVVGLAAAALAGCGEVAAPESATPRPPTAASAAIDRAEVVLLRDAVDRLAPALDARRGTQRLVAALTALGAAAGAADDAAIDRLLAATRETLRDYAATATETEAADVAAVALALDAIPSIR